MSKYPAGWHPVPNSDQERYWDGSAWTDAYRPKSGQISANINTPAYPQQGVIGPPTSGMAVASMILGIVSIVLFWAIGFIFAIVGLILGSIAIKECEPRGNKKGGGMAIAGIVCSSIGLLIWILIIVGIAASS